MLIAVSQLQRLADNADGETAFQIALTDTGVQHRRFPSGVRANDQDGVGFIDTGDC